MNVSAKRLTFLALSAALALILSYVETLLPPLWPTVAGIKAGLANIVTLFVLYRCGIKEAAAVSLVRLLGAMLLFGTPMTFLYSAAGAAVSLLLMAAAKHLSFFTPVGVSILGGISHNAGQILVAIAVMRTVEIGYYMIVLTVTGTVAGILIGLAGAALLKAFERCHIVP